VEQRLVKALGWLKAETATLPKKLRTVGKAFASTASDDPDALLRMGLDQPHGAVERLYARLIRHALHVTRN
jgi:hypothetical protein